MGKPMWKKKYFMTKSIVSVVIGCAIIQLTACGATELEERCFPLLVTVDYDEDWKKVSFCERFPRTGGEGKEASNSNELQIDSIDGATFKGSKEGYEARLNKMPDYNHLKVLVLGETFVENTNAYNGMLKSLAATEEFPRNTYVCVVEDVEDLLEIDKNLSQDLGTYLEEYLNNHEKKKNRMLTLGDLIDEKENKDMILYAPYLAPKENYVDWGGYYAIGEGIIFPEDE